MPRDTPPQADWSRTCDEVADSVDDHVPRTSVAWDKTTIYDPISSLNLTNPRDGSVFFDQICPRNEDNKKVLRGHRQLLDEVKPFADNNNPLKAEVDRWNEIVMNHIRNLVGIDHPAKIDVCIMARALWAGEWRNTRKWQQKDAMKENQYVCSIKEDQPNTFEKQRPIYVFTVA